jgi:hypothetical protein
MAKWQTKAVVALAAASMAVPASASIFEYEMTNGDVLTINTDTQSGTWSGDKVNATFTSKDFADFQGGANPSFSFTLASMDGTRIVRGQEYASTTRNGNRFHPQMIKTTNNGRVNLWSWWGNPVVAGDWVQKIAKFTDITPGTDVPAPGMLGLFGLALAALGLRSRRRKQAA